jgi:TPR repeat protein
MKKEIVPRFSFFFLILGCYYQVAVTSQDSVFPLPDLVSRIRREAASGSRDALYQLGVLLYLGQGLPEDPVGAQRAFRQAAERGHPAAAANLGIMLETGSDAVQKDLPAAFAWYSAAAAGGERQGMFRAGKMLYEGLIPNYEERERIADAFDFFERAVALDHPEAYYFLAVLYEYGAHRPQNFTEAAKLYRAGCDHREYRLHRVSRVTITGAEDGAGSFANLNEGSRGDEGGGGGGGSNLKNVIGDADCCFHLGLLTAYGRGIEQNGAAAEAIFQTCYNMHAHAGCALYLGMLHAGGQAAGGRVDYDLARIYLQKAADAGDVRFAKEAHTAYSRLDGLIQEAEAMTASTLESLRAGQAMPKEERAARERETFTTRQETIIEAEVQHDTVMAARLQFRENEKGLIDSED